MLVTRVLFDGRRAIGVEYLVGETKRVARASAEVIVSAGTFEYAAAAAAFRTRPGVVAFDPLVFPSSPRCPEWETDSTITMPVASCCAAGSRSPSTTRFATGAASSPPVCDMRSRVEAFWPYQRLRRGVSYRVHPSSATPDCQCSMALFSGDAIGGELHPFPGMTAGLHAVAAGESRLRAHSIR